jgi:uncharacterized phage protein (TIGR01671 family)
MNKFKFRVWHKTLEKFLSPDEWVISLDGELIFWFIGSDRIHKVPKDLYVIQQFTGLRDKNGKDIYEEDIVICIQEKQKYIGKVGFSGGSFWFYGETSFPLLQTYSEELKVIGNIFQNPELLKNEKM